MSSTASGDFDNDQLADQVFLYTTKLVFYFSTDRSVRTLPFGNQYKGTEVYLPRNCYGKALRILDLDNDGKEELLIGAPIQESLLCIREVMQKTTGQ